MRAKAPLPQTIASKRAASPSHLLASAIASQQIEGLQLTPQSATELSQVADGTLSASELRLRLLERYRKPAAHR